MTNGGCGRLRLAIYPSGEWLVFEIEDTGRGMSPAIAAMIFEPFFTHGKPEGTGLGMAMAKSVVDAHRGEIRVESEPGRGTKFEVKVPLHRYTRLRGGEPERSFYLLRRPYGAGRAMDFLRDLVSFCTVARVGHAEAVRSLEYGLNDFEDALQLSAARSGGATVILTRNGKDFGQPSDIVIQSPEEFAPL